MAPAWESHFAPALGGRNRKSKRNERNPMTIDYLEMFVAATFALALPSVAMAQTIAFADAAIGSKPKDFAYGLTGGGPAPNWEIVADATAVGGKALAQT